MNFHEVTVQLSRLGMDWLGGELTDLGIGGFIERDPEEFRAFLQGTQTPWDFVEEALLSLLEQQPSLTFYVSDTPQGRRQLEAVRQLLEQRKGDNADSRYGSLRLWTDSVAEEDWANNWKQYFHTFNVGNRLTVKPSWEPLPPNDGRVVLQIDPASSFGTGTHHTTQLCLLQLEQLPVEGAKVLDMGCGSGILGIAAILLGARHVTAVDIDQNAVRVAHENARQNGIPADRFRLLCGDVTGNQTLSAQVADGYDIVLANIVADVLIAMRRELHDFLCQGGHLVVSGILTARADEVAARLAETGLQEIRRQEQEDWVAIALRRDR